MFVRQPIAMITHFLERLEDPKRRLLGPNIWILTWVGLLLPENKFLRGVSYFLHGSLSYCVISEYIEIYAIRSDLDQVIENVKASLFAIVCSIKADAFLFRQDRWKRVLEYVTEADDYERAHKDEIRGEIIDGYTKYCRRLTYSFWGLVFVTFLATLLVPVLKLLSASFQEGYRNGTEPFPHMISTWMPFDKYHSPGNWITFIWHCSMCTYGWSLVAAYDSYILVIMTFFGGKLDLLRERAKLMLGTPGNEIRDEEARKRMRHLHHDHILLLKQSRLFNSLLSPILFVYVVTSSLSICTITFQLTSSTNTSQKVFSVVLLLLVLSQLFMYCWHGNNVKVKSEQLSFGPYENNWYTANVQQRKSVLMLAGQFQIKHEFTAGPFTSLTLYTFITILKGAYSYYTLLKK